MRRAIRLTSRPIVAELTWHSLPAHWRWLLTFCERAYVGSSSVRAFVSICRAGEPSYGLVYHAVLHT